MRILRLFLFPHLSNSSIIVVLFRPSSSPCPKSSWKLKDALLGMILSNSFSDSTSAIYLRLTVSKTVSEVIGVWRLQSSMG